MPQYLSRDSPQYGQEVSPKQVAGKSTKLVSQKFRHLQTKSLAVSKTKPPTGAASLDTSDEHRYWHTQSKAPGIHRRTLTELTTWGMPVRKMPSIEVGILRGSVQLKEAVSVHVQGRMRADSAFMIEPKRTLPMKLQNQDLVNY